MAAGFFSYFSFLDVGGGVPEETKPHAHVHPVQVLGDGYADIAEARVVAGLVLDAGCNWFGCGGSVWVWRGGGGGGGT